MNRLGLLLVSLALAGCVNASPPPEFVGTYSLLESSVALVSESGGIFCSGVSVQEGILTAAHCVGDATVRVSRPDDVAHDRVLRARRVRVLLVDTAHDLALLHRPGDFPYVPILQENPRLGSAVRVIGNPTGVPFVVHHGFISREAVERDWPGPSDFFLTDAGIIGGNSGGPVFSSSGHLAGIVSFVFCGGRGCSETLGGAIPAETVRDFLELS